MALGRATGGAARSCAHSRYLLPIGRGCFQAAIAADWQFAEGIVKQFLIKLLLPRLLLGLALARQVVIGGTGDRGEIVDVGPQRLAAWPHWGRPEAIRRLIEAILAKPGNRKVTNFDVDMARLKDSIENGDSGLANLSPSNCRAARALLLWSQEDLVRASGITKKTIADFERGATQPHQRTLTQILSAFQAAGIEFLNTRRPGVRLGSGKI